MFGMVRHPSHTSTALTGLSAESSEAGLIRRAVEGQTEAFCELVLPYQRAVFMAAYAILQNEADAEDATQDAVLNAFMNVSKFRRDSKFGTWLYRIAINAALMKLRTNRRQAQTSLDEQSQNENGDYIPRDLADDRALPSEQLLRTELRQVLLQALVSLHPKYRTVLILRDLQQFTIAETADLLGVREGVVKTRLLRARLQMRDALAPYLNGGRSIGRSESIRKPTHRNVGRGQYGRGSKRNSVASSW